MSEGFPGAVPEIPVRDLARAAAYYEKYLGFTHDWGVEGIAQVSKGNCRLFLTDDSFREDRGNVPPTVIWLNLDSKAAVDALYDVWVGSGAHVVARPESKPWNLHEFTAADPDGNLFRVFYDFTRDAVAESSSNL